MQANSNAVYTNELEFLEQLCKREALYFSSIGLLEQTPHAYYLRQEALPEYHDLNRAFHLREDGCGVQEVVTEVIQHFRNQGRAVIADVDPIAEAQGIGFALRQRGVLPLIGEMLVMAVTSAQASIYVPADLRIEVIAKSSLSQEQWIALLASESEPETYAMWKQVAQIEAESPLTRLYLASLGETPIATCSLASIENWGRIDSVFTLPEYRRQGVATALVAIAVRDSLAQGDCLCYLFTERGGEGEQVYQKLGFEIIVRNPLRRHMG